jgi:hypothetical protein
MLRIMTMRADAVHLDEPIRTEQANAQANECSAKMAGL